MSSQRRNKSNKNPAESPQRTRSNRVITRRQARRAEIDEQRKPIEERRRLNEQAPISRLPPEVLLLIFVHAKDGCYYYGTYDYGAPACYRDHDSDIIDWVKVTYVCRRWRDIALDTPSLWSDIRIWSSDCKWASEMLRRSRQSPLTVHVDFEATMRGMPDRGVATRALRALEKKLSQCRELTLRHDHNGALQKVFGRRLAPHLHTLRIARDLFSHSSSNTHFTLCNDILHADSLRRLSLVFCHVDWNAHFMQRLTHLRLRDVPPDSRPTLPAFLAAMVNIPTLEVLDLHDGVYTQSIPATSTRTLLPSITDFRLNARMDEAACIFSHITFSPTIRIHIYTFWDEDNYISEIYRSLLSEIASYSSPPASSSSAGASGPLRSLRFMTNGGGQYNLQAFRSVLSQEESLSSCLDPTLDLDICWDALDKELEEEVCEALIAAFSLIQLEMLQVHMSRNARLTPEIWARTFGAIPTLRSILISGHADAFIEGIVRPSGASKIEDALPFCGLNSIFLHRLHPELLHDVDLADDAWVDFVHDSLLQSLQVRHENGANLQQLVFLECPAVRDTDLAALLQFIMHVEESNKQLAFDYAILKHTVGDTGSLAEADEDWVRLGIMYLDD